MSTLDKSNYIEEISKLTTAIENDSSNSQLFLLRGNLYFNIKEYQKAVNDYTVSIERNTKDPFEVIQYRCCSYCKLKNYKKVLEHLFLMAEMNPLNDKAYCCLGRVYSEQDDYHNTIKYYSKAIELIPLNSNALNGRGIAFRRLGYEEHAIDDFTKAIEANPLYDGCYYNRGLSYIKLKKFEDARNDFSKAIELNPNNSDAISEKEKLEFEILREAGIYSLSCAVEKNNLDAIKFYLEGMEDWKSRRCELSDWLLALTTAVKHKSYTIIDCFLSRDTKGDLIFSENRKFHKTGEELHEAAKFGYLDIIQRLVEYNKTCRNEYDKINDKPWRSFIIDHIEEEEYINLEDEEGNTALVYAVQNNHVDVVIYLIGKKANFTVSIYETERESYEYEGYDYEFGYYDDTRDVYIDHCYTVSLLHKIYQSISLSMLELLLHYGLDINDSGYKGKTVLHRACKENNLEVVKLLISHGAMLSLTDSNMKTPLYYAKGQVYDYIVEILEKS